MLNLTDRRLFSTDVRLELDNVSVTNETQVNQNG